MSVDPNSVANSPVNEVVVIPPGATKFDANGKTYYLQTTLSMGRYQSFKKMEMELGFNLNFKTLADKLIAAYSAANDNRFADTVVALKQTMDGIALFNENRYGIAQYVSTLFINTLEEDKSKWDKALAESKLQDWENIDSAFFLSFALAQVRSFPEKLEEITRMIQKAGDVKVRMEEFIED